jgi:hypothetical protein
MIWMLGIPVCMVMIFRSLYNEIPPNDFMDWVMQFMMTGLMTIPCSLPLIGIACVLGMAFDTHPVQTDDYKLVAIRDKDGITGQFFLGTGMIQSEQYYFYYKTNSDGSVTPDKVRAGQGVRVYEEDRQDAELVVYEWQLNQSWAWLVAFPVNSGGWSYKFHVPKGTVRTGFTM